MNMKLLNLPAAVVTIIFRRIIDSHIGIRTHRIISKGPWLTDHFTNPHHFYLYAIGALFTFIVNHARKGTLITMAKRCSSNAYMFKDKYLQQRRWLKRNRSWVLRNLLSSRENQKKAINYLSTQIPSDNEQTAVNVNTMKNSTGSCNLSHHSKRSSKKSLLLPKSQTSHNVMMNDPIPEYSPNVCEKGEDVEHLSSACCAPIKIDLTKTESLDRKVIDSVDDLKISKQKSEGKFSKGDFTENVLKPELNNSEAKDEETSNDSAAEERKSLASDSIMDVYTKSVIRELIPSDCSEDSELEQFKHPFKRNRKRKNWRDNFKKASVVRKTRSGRVYGFREVNGKRVRYNIL